MDNIFNLLENLLVPLSESDKEFVKEYWRIILKSMLSPYQRKLEADLSYNILSTQTKTKTFFEPLVPIANNVHYRIQTLPVTLPDDIYDISCIGDEYDVTEVVTLPIKIAGARDIICDCPGCTIDREIILGEGDWTVTYKTNIVTDFTFEHGVLSSKYNIKDVYAKKGNGPDSLIRVNCEILQDRIVYVPDVNLAHASVGMRVKLGTIHDYIEEVIDKHRFRTVNHFFAPGTLKTLEIDLFPYSYATDIAEIPSFYDGKTNGVDYIMLNGGIAFPSPQRDPLVTQRAYRQNKDLWDRFIKFFATYPDDTDLWIPFWHAVFTNRIDLFLYASIAYPYTTPDMGTMRVVNIEYTHSNDKYSTDFTNLESNGRISSSGSYFDGDENGILFTDGSFGKIVKRRLDNEVELFHVPFKTTASGYAARFSVTAIALEDDYGKTVYFRVPSGQFPLVKVGDIVEPWTMLVTGLKVFDRTERDDYIDFEGVDKFIDIPGVACHPNALQLLTANTFVILSDEQIDVPDNILRFLVGSWTQWHMLDNRGESISIRDDAVMYSVHVLVFRHFLPESVREIIPSYNMAPRLQNHALIHHDMPMEFLGDYDGIAPVITNLRWTDGTPLDISAWGGLKYIVENFGTSPGKEAMPGNAMAINPGAGNLMLSPFNSIFPSVGTDLRFSFVKATKVITVSTDFYSMRGGVFTEPGMEVARALDGEQSFFLDECLNLGTYAPGIYSLSDLAFADEIRMEYKGTAGTRVSGTKLVDTDFERLGARIGMMLVHDLEVSRIVDFDTHGQPILSPPPGYGTLSSDFGFYCFVAEKNDGTISKN